MNFFDQSNIEQYECRGSGNTAEEVAEAIVDSYTEEEIAERLTDWMAGPWTKCDVFEAWADVIGVAEGEQDAVFDRIWSDGSIRKFVLPQLVAGNNSLWDSFAKFYVAVELGNLEAGDE